MHAFRSILCVIAATLCLSACVFEATEVKVLLGTDAPLDRDLSIVATVRGPMQTAPPQAFVLERNALDGGITLPGTFAVTPAHAPHNSSVTLELTATVASGAHGEPLVRLHRLARFVFTEHTTTLLPIFLPMACANPADGCTTRDVPCTVTQYCEDHGQTCGDHGVCVGIDTMPQPLDGAVLGFDATSSDDRSDARDSNTDATFSDATDTMTMPDTAVSNAPHLIAPMSTSYVESQRPVLRWSLAPGSSGASVTLCRDRAMTMGCLTFATGTSVVLTGGGVWFWHVQAVVSGMSLSSPIWEFYVANSSAATDAAHAASVGPSFIDVNGDGYADVLVTSNPSSGSDGGRVSVFHGGLGGPRATPSTVIEGPDGPGGLFGGALAGGGDFDGDGYGDVVIASPSVSRVHVFLGGPAGLPTTPSFSISSPAAAAGFGVSVAGIGDIDDDGYGDLAIGAPTTNGSRGQVYVYRGGASGIGVGAPTVLDAPGAADHLFGQAIASLGDWTGDGLVDYAIGAPGTTQGAVYVYPAAHGSVGTLATSTIMLAGGGDLGNAVAAAGDVDNDGAWDVLCAGSSNVRMQTHSGSVVQLGTPSAAVAALGDATGDGFPDWGFSDPTAAFNSGEVHANAGGPGSTSNIFANISSPDITPLQFGVTVALAGDVDGNGHLDLIVGEIITSAPFLTSHAYLYLVTSMGIPTTPSITLSGDASDPGFGNPVAFAPRRANEVTSLPL